MTASHQAKRGKKQDDSWREVSHQPPHSQVSGRRGTTCQRMRSACSQRWNQNGAWNPQTEADARRMIVLLFTHISCDKTLITATRAVCCLRLIAYCCAPSISPPGAGCGSLLSAPLLMDGNEQRWLAKYIAPHYWIMPSLALCNSLL